MTITNNTGGAINLQTLDLEAWDNSGGTHLKTVELDSGNQIWSGNQNGGPFVITTFSGDVTINSGQTRTLIFDFTPKNAPATGTSFFIFFDISCHIAASN